MSKKCFLVTAYCNTEEKKQVLYTTLKNLSRFEIDIILFSHYPVEEKSIHLSDFTLYDFSNPIIEYQNRSIIQWNKLNCGDNPIPFKLSQLMIDYGYAAAQQWKRGLEYAYDLGFKEVFILNYDLDVTFRLFEYTNNLLSECDNVIFEYGDNPNNPEIFLPWHALKLSNFIDIIQSISYEDYINKVGEDIVEKYMYEKFKTSNSISIPRKEWENPNNKLINTLITLDAQLLPKHKTNYCTWFLGQEKMWLQGDLTGYNNCVLLLFNIKSDLDVKVYIKNELISSSLIPQSQNYHLLYLPFLYTEFKDKVNSLKILINDFEIPKELLILGDISAIEVNYDNQE